ncbi:MAG: hypothetical protein JWP29_1730 [Rhodoferax sp.]|nr:hypothetical protein [Rhodoferax sp.]
MPIRTMRFVPGDASGVPVAFTKTAPAWAGRQVSAC